MTRKPKKPKTDAELIDAFAHGIEERSYASVAAQSQRFVVFKIKGHSAWAARGVQEYAKTQYILIRKGDWWMSGKPTRKWEGRVSPQTLKEALRRSELFGKVYDGDFPPMCSECDIEMSYGSGYEGDKLVEYYRCDQCGWSIDA
jgi:hypothetical protein